MHVARRVMQIFLVVCAAFPALACENAAIFKSSRHLELGVRFSTRDPRIVEQTSFALNRWSEIADISWHGDNSNNCSIDVEDGTFTDDKEVAEANASNGSIVFASAGELTARELWFTAFHEIGHLLGLQHNANPHSVMYWIDFRGDEVLDVSDMRALSAAHALRAECNEGAPCEILSPVFSARNTGSDTRSLGTALAASRTGSLGPTAKRARHHRRRRRK